MFLLISGFAQCMDAPFEMTVKSVDDLFDRLGVCAIIKPMIIDNTIDPNEVFSKEYYCISRDTTIADVALYRNRADILGSILETGKVKQYIKDELLYYAAVNCKLGCMKVLLDYQANPNVENSAGYLPLTSLLSMHNDIDDISSRGNGDDDEEYSEYLAAINILVNSGCVWLHMKDKSGYSAYDYAEESTDPRIKQLFRLDK